MKEPEINWIIVFEDNDVDHEVFDDEQSAIARFKELGVSWNCHLFRRVESNFQDS